MDQSPVDMRIEVARNNLRMACALRGMNLSEVSRAAGMSRNGLGQFITGRTSLSFANLLKICDVLNVPVGIIHRTDAITENRIRLYRTLERMPEHLASQALQAARRDQEW